MGQPNYAVPFLAPNATGKSVLYGVNYASGGGGILNATGRIFVSISNSLVSISYSFIMYNEKFICSMTCIGLLHFSG